MIRLRKEMAVGKASERVRIIVHRNHRSCSAKSSARGVCVCVCVCVCARARVRVCVCVCVCGVCTSEP
jgi:hypothetical protein